MKKVLMLCLAACLLLVLTGFQAQATLSSTFDSDAEGWTGVGPFFSWYPAGYIGYEIEPGPVGFFAPLSWRGDWSQYLHGTFEFDFKWNQVSFVTLAIQKEGFKYAAYSITLPDSSGDWTHFSVSLDSPNTITGGTIEEIFGDVNDIYFTIFPQGGAESDIDHVFLDNVKVVPLPSALLLLGSGLLGLGAVGWRRRRKE